MPVSDASALALLRALGMLEFTLKRMPGFVAADGDPLINQRAKAKANWPAVDRAVAALPPEVFLGRVTEGSRSKLLGGIRNRPKQQFVRVSASGAWTAEYLESRLPVDEAEALIVAMRRVRNNLFHGGKEDPLEESHPRDDEEWAVAALEIATLLLELVERGQLRRAVP